GAGRPAGLAGRPQVELLLAEFERDAAVCRELLALHAERAPIPGGDRLHVTAVHHHVVDALDRDAHGAAPLPFRRSAMIEDRDRVGKSVRYLTLVPRTRSSHQSSYVC